MALVSIALLYAAGALLGVRLPVEQWLGMTVMILIGLVPFAALGITTMSSPRSRWARRWRHATAMFALLGGAWGPIATSGFLHTLSECLPSYWLVQAGKLAEAGTVRPALVFAVWTLALGRLAASLAA